jgi:hypothetical protein
MAVIVLISGTMPDPSKAGNKTEASAMVYTDLMC